MRFHHVTGDGVAGVDVVRRPVAAGSIRFAHGKPETHSVEYLGDRTAEYIRIELRTEPIDRPARDIRLPSVPLDLSRGAVETQFENGQVRILRVGCPAGRACPLSEHPDDHAVVVILSGRHRGEAEWSPGAMMGPLELVRLELKSGPVRQMRP